MDHLSALRLRVIHELYKNLITISHELTRFFWTGARSSYVITSFGYIIQNSVVSLIFAHETLPSIYRKEKALFYRLKTQLFLKFLRKQKKPAKQMLPQTQNEISSCIVSANVLPGSSWFQSGSAPWQTLAIRCSLDGSSQIHRLPWQLILFSFLSGIHHFLRIYSHSFFQFFVFDVQRPYWNNIIFY